MWKIAWHFYVLSERQGQAFQAEGRAQRWEEKCVRVQGPGSFTEPSSAASLGVHCVNGE